MNSSPATTAEAHRARSRSKTPLTDKEPRLYAPQPNATYADWTPLVHAQRLELLLWEAQSLLARSISDGTLPTLHDDEMQDFLKKLETPEA